MCHPAHLPLLRPPCCRSRWEVTAAGDTFPELDAAGRTAALPFAIMPRHWPHYQQPTPPPPLLQPSAALLFPLLPRSSSHLHFLLPSSSTLPLIHPVLPSPHPTPSSSSLAPLLSTPVLLLLLFCVFSKIADRWELLHLGVKHCLAFFPAPPLKRKKKTQRGGAWIFRNRMQTPAES